jgi:hypothetical protein
MTNTNLNGILFSLETYYVTPIIVLSSIQVTNRVWTLLFHLFLVLRRVWKYQRGNQNLYIKEGQTTQCPKEKVQKDKQWSTKHTRKTKDRVTRTALKIEGGHTGHHLACSLHGEYAKSSFRNPRSQ